MGNRRAERPEGGSDPQDREQPFESTTWEWRQVKIRRPPEATGRASMKSTRWRRFPTRNARVPINAQIKLRGGPECWIEITARGETNRYPGWTSIYDVLSDINQL